MKKKVLVISNNFYPVFNGTVTCLCNMIEYMSEVWDVTLVCSQKGDVKRQCATYYGAHIQRLGTLIDYLMCIKEEWLRVWNNKRLNRVLIGTAVVFLIKCFFGIPTIASKKYGFYEERNFYNNAYPILEKKIKNFDMIMTIGEPYGDVKLAYNLKKNYPSITWCLIQFDLYAYNPNVSENGRTERLLEELEWYKYADLVIVQPEMRKVIEDSPLNIYQDKLHTLSVPSLNFNHKYLVSRNLPHNKINLVYTGMFYKDIRNPEFMLRLLSEVCKLNPRIILHLVGFGCEDIIDSYKKIMKENLVLYGRKNKEDTDLIMNSADILINVSNSASTVTPSKIMEYIGTCKPIINIYSNEDDTCERYLKEYPVHIGAFSNASFDQQILSLLEFIEKNKDVKCDYAQIKKIFFEFSAENFVDNMVVWSEGSMAFE